MRHNQFITPYALSDYAKERKRNQDLAINSFRLLAEVLKPFVNVVVGFSCLKAANAFQQVNRYIQRISVNKMYYFVPRIEIYPVDSVIQPIEQPSSD